MDKSAFLQALSAQLKHWLAAVANLNSLRGFLDKCALQKLENSTLFGGRLPGNPTVHVRSRSVYRKSH
jgi:hypothetical protein